MKTFSSLAQIPHSGIKTMADRGVRVSVDTNELTSEELATLFEFKGKVVKFVLASEDGKIETEDLEIPQEITEYKGEKTKSQRLRASLYIMWQQGKQDKTFEEFYAIQMERLIEIVKSKLS